MLDENTKELFKFMDSHCLPWEGILGDSPEARVIHVWLGLDYPPDQRSWFTIQELSEFADISKMEVEKAVDRLVHFKVIEKDGEKFSVDYSTGYWKGLDMLNDYLIEVVCDKIEKRENYIRGNLSVKEDGTYSLVCPMCSSDMEDKSWEILPLGDTIYMVCPSCNFSYGLAVRREMGDIPSRALMPDKDRSRLLKDSPYWVEEYNGELEEYLQEIELDAEDNDRSKRRDESGNRGNNRRIRNMGK